MSETKARLIGAITVMDESGAQRLWQIVQNLYSSDAWENIQEEQPDEFDLQMILDAQQNPDCRTAAAPEELRSLL